MNKFRSFSTKNSYVIAGIIKYDKPEDYGMKSDGEVFLDVYNIIDAKDGFDAVNIYQSNLTSDMHPFFLEAFLEDNVESAKKYAQELSKKNPSYQRNF